MTRTKPKTLTPKRRFPEFRDAPGWQSKPLGDACEVLNNRRVPITTKDRKAGQYPYYGASGIVDYVEDFIFDERLVLVGEDGAKWEAFDSTAFIAEGKYWVNNHAHVLRSIDLIDTLLENYLVRTDVGPYVTGAAPPKLTLNKLKTIPIPIPPSKAEQQKIADCLGSLDAWIAAAGRKLAALRDHKRGLMQQLFPQPGQSQPQQRFSEFQGKGQWGETPLGKLLSRKPEYGVNAAAVPFSQDLPKYIRITDIDDDGNFAKNNLVSVDINATEENYLDEGDIVLARTGASVGKSYRYREEDGRLVFAGFLIRVKPNQKKLATEFLANYLTTWTYWDWVRVNSARSGQPGINGSEYASMPVPMPPTKAEQQQVAACLSALDTQVTAQAAQLDTLHQHKRGLMQQLFPSPEQG